MSGVVGMAIHWDAVISLFGISVIAFAATAVMTTYIIRKIKGK